MDDEKKYVEKMKRYGAVYDMILKNSVKKEEKKKTLNEYQKFFQKETEKYQDLPASERMSIIALNWEKEKKRKKKENQRKLKKNFHEKKE